MSKEFKTKTEGLTIRYVEDGEEGLVLQLIKEIAEYEKMSDCVKATEEGLHKALFEQHDCNCLIVEYEKKPIGFCLYFHMIRPPPSRQTVPTGRSVRWKISRRNAWKRNRKRDFPCIDADCRRRGMRSSRMGMS